MELFLRFMNMLHIFSAADTQNPFWMFNEGEVLYKQKWKKEAKSTK